MLTPSGDVRMPVPIVQAIILERKMQISFLLSQWNPFGSQDIDAIGDQVCFPLSLPVLDADPRDETLLISKERVREFVYKHIYISGFVTIVLS